MATYLGLDPSLSSYGAVALIDGEVMTWRGKFPPGDSQYDRLYRVYDFVADIAQEVPPGAIIAMEGYAMGAKFGREVAGELRAATLLGLNEMSIIVAPQAVKKFTLGKGGSQAKALMLKGVYSKWGFDTDVDDLADAFALAKVAEAVHLYRTEGQIPELAYEREVVEKILADKKGAVQ